MNEGVSEQGLTSPFSTW